MTGPGLAERNAAAGHPMTSSSEGLIRKFKVERLTPSSRGIDHTDCRYFVLDLTHDPMARIAALDYARQCEREYPNLAADLRFAVKKSMDAEPIREAKQ